MGCQHVRRHAVEANGGRTSRFQIAQHLSAVRPGEQRPVRLHGEGVHGGSRAFQLGGGENGLCLLRVKQGLADEQIGPAVNQTADLAAVILHQQVEAVRVPALAVNGQRGQVARNEASGGGGAGQSNQRFVDFLRLGVHAHGFQGDGLRLKGGGVNDLAARGGVGALERDQRFRVFQHPLLGAAVLGHSGGAEVGAGGAVQNVDALLNLLLKFFFCKHKDTSLDDQPGNVHNAARPGKNWRMDLT